MLRSALQSFGTLHAHPPLALPGQRIGLMGGTFNPPHEGHVVCAETALKRLRLDQLWWIVTPGNPLKSPSGRLRNIGCSNVLSRFHSITAQSNCWRHEPDRVNPVALAWLIAAQADGRRK